MTEAYISQRGAALVGVAAGLVAAGLAGLALAGTAELGVGLFVVQVLFVLAWLAALDVQGGVGAFVLAVGATAVADVVVAVSDEPDIGQAAGVLGVLLVLSLVFQLFRRPRLDVTGSIAGTLSAATLAVAGGCYLALLPEGGGSHAVAAALFGAGAALFVGRLADVVAPRPPAVPGAARGVVGVVLGIGAAALVGWLYGGGDDVLTGSSGLRLALAAAVIAVVTDLAVDAVTHAAPPSEERARSALSPLGIMLPIVVAGPAAYVAGRILLG